jgi:CMP-2-keto-3-deoxyoctulosonic acid synthetase
MEKDYQQIYLNYREKCKEFAKAYNEKVSDHIIDIMVSVCMTRDNHKAGGSFVQAVVNNNLHEAISRADQECLKNLRIITLTRHYCELNWTSI